MDFVRYLDAKRALDDRSLHPRVWDGFCERVTGSGDILDIGCGLGATLDRLLSVIEPEVRYTGIDRDAALVDIARTRHAEMPNANFRVANLADFAASTERQATWPIIVAHAFLDLLDLDGALDSLMAMLEPDGLVYFSLNFDDLSVMEPPIDPGMDDAILSAYHASMYAPRWGGNGGDGRTGRRLFHALTARGFDVLDIGPSDWVIAPLGGTYRDDDRMVLEYLLDHIVDVVRADRALPEDQLAGWAMKRRLQVEHAQLIYIAHQIDILAQHRPAPIDYPPPSAVTA